VIDGRSARKASSCCQSDVRDYCAGNPDKMGQSILWCSRLSRRVEGSCVQDSEIKVLRQHIYSLSKQGRHDRPRHLRRHDALIGWFLAPNYTTRWLHCREGKPGSGVDGSCRSTSYAQNHILNTASTGSLAAAPMGFIVFDWRICVRCSRTMSS